MESEQTAARVRSRPTCDLTPDYGIDGCLLRGASPRHCFPGRRPVILCGAVPAAVFRVETVRA